MLHTGKSKTTSHGFSLDRILLFFVIRFRYLLSSVFGVKYNNEELYAFPDLFHKILAIVKNIIGIYASFMVLSFFQEKM